MLQFSVDCRRKNHSLEKWKMKLVIFKAFWKKKRYLISLKYEKNKLVDPYRKDGNAARYKCSFYDPLTNWGYIFVDQNSKMVDIEIHLFTLDYMGKWKVIFSETRNLLEPKLNINNHEMVLCKSKPRWPPSQNTTTDLWEKNKF
jgi:hypothetical protein